MRSRRIIGPKLRKLIPCGYCFEEWADCYDHINPVCNGGTNKKSNLYPACARCNSLASGLVFSSLDEKRDYLKRKLKEREEWHSAEEMQKLREALPADTSTVAEVLFRSLPIGKVERAKRVEKKFGKLCICCGDRSANIICGKMCKEVLWFNRLLDKFLEADVNIGLRNKLEKLAGLPITAPTGSLNFKPPQARIPVKVQVVKWTPSGAGLAVQLDTGKWLYCFDNKKMGEDREELFNILLTAPGKECIFLTKESKKKNSDQTYINITHLLQCGDREWGEDGVPVLRREPASKPAREPGEDTEEQWLK